MASIIRLKNLPQKWIFFRSKVSIDKNCIISVDEFEKKKNKIKSYKENNLAKKLIEDFLSKKHGFYCKAYQKNFRQQQSNLIIELLVFLVNITSMFEIEAQGIVDIAGEICCRVTGQNNKINNANLYASVQNDLLSIIDVKIYLPSFILNSVKNDYYFLPKMFNNKQLYFSCENESSAKLDICICKKSCQLYFNSDDIHTILSSVLKKLSHKKIIP